MNIVYSTADCPWCKRAKDFLRSNKISFVERNVATNAKFAKEMIKKSGQYGVPVIEINKKIIVGYNEDALKKAIKKK